MKHYVVRFCALILTISVQILTGCTESENLGKNSPVLENPSEGAPSLIPIEVPVAGAPIATAPTELPVEPGPASQIETEPSSTESPLAESVPTVGTTNPSSTPVSSDPDESEEIIPSAETEESPYVFDPKTKSCKNEEGLTGLNSGAVTSCSDQSGGMISNKNLSGSDLSGINLSGSNIENTNLARTNLTAADVTDAKLDNVIIDGAKIDEAEFDNSTISNSDLRDFDTIDQLVENGLEIGINNKLPTLVAEIEAVLRDESSVETKEKLPIDEFIDEREVASESSRSSARSELKEEAASLKEEIKKMNEKIEENYKEIKSARTIIKEIKDDGKRKQADVKGIKNQVIAAKKDLKSLLWHKKDLSAKLRELKKKFKVADSPKEKDFLKEEMKRTESERKEIVQAIRDFRGERNRTIANIRQTQNDIDQMLNRVSGQRDLLRDIKRENQKSRESIKQYVKRYKEIRKKMLSSLAGPKSARGYV